MKLNKNSKVADKDIVNRVKNGETVLCLSRHGESEGNVDSSIYKHTRNSKIPITKKGESQVKEAAYQMCKLFHQLLPYPWQTEKFRLYASPYLRAVQSADIFANALLSGKLFGREKAIKIGALTRNHLLAEQDYGLAEGCTSMENYISENEEEQLRWNRLGSYLYTPPRGENLRDVYVRCGLFVEREQWFMNKTNNTFNIICSHKGVCIELEHYLTGVASDDWKNAETRIYIVNSDLRQVSNWATIK